jgi:hypothetical protein
VTAAELSPHLLGPFLSPAALRPLEYRPPSAWTSHAPFAMWLMAQARPAQVVELGTQNGLSFFAFCQAARDWGVDARVCAVDTWVGDEHAGYYGPQVQASVFDHARRYEGIAQMLATTFDEARTQFGEGTVDLLHIDGLHTYEAVRHDFDTWLPTLSDRGVVLLHDTNVRERGFGVWRLLEELSATYPVFEFHHGFGLGVVVVGAEADPAVRQLAALDEQSAQQVRAVYEALGRRWEWSAAMERRFTDASANTRTLAEARREGDRWKAEAAAGRAQVAELQGQLREARRAAAVAEDQLRVVEESTIWRLSRPYRTGVIGRLRRP